LGLLAVAACLVLAARPTPADEKAATYEVDPKASRVYVKLGSATRLGHPHGVQGEIKSGKLTLGGDGELVFDMASFTADTAEARQRVGLASKKVSQNEAKKVTGALRGPDVLAVERYPTATYRITSIAPLDKQPAGQPGAYELKGRFTLHGTEQDLRFKAQVERAGKQGGLKLTGTFTVRQTDYGMTPYAAAGGLVKVADALEIAGELLLRPAPAP
jgi:polyisoprenoid-binding protein YceI